MNFVTRRLSVFTERSFWSNLAETLRYSLYVITHPIDGFWDLTHERRGSMGAANVIVILTLLTRVWKLRFTSFQFNAVNWQEVNIFMEFASVLLPLAIFCICNWGVTTLFNGKGTMKNIYMGTAYAITPYPLIQIPLIILSRLITFEEGTFYQVFSTISLAWSAGLIVAAMMMIHAYSLKKTLLFMVITVFAMMIFIFIFMLFFSMISDGFAYFISLAREIIFRLN